LKPSEARMKTIPKPSYKSFYAAVALLLTSIWKVLIILDKQGLGRKYHRLEIFSEALTIRGIFVGDMVLFDKTYDLRGIEVPICHLYVCVIRGDTGRGTIIMIII